MQDNSGKKQGGIQQRERERERGCNTCNKASLGYTAGHTVAVLSVPDKAVFADAKETVSAPVDARGIRGTVVLAQNAPPI